MVRAVRPRSGKAAKAAKNAKRVLRRVATRTAPQSRREPSDHAVKLGELETDRMKARLARHDETKRRNADTQRLPKSKRQKKESRHVDTGDDVNLERDKHDFFAAIDAPLYRVCGSCGELANSDNSILRLYDPKSIFLAPLCNGDGECEIIPEGLVTGDSNEGNISIWLCERCYGSLLARKAPKFCRSSGFRIASVPSELADLNRMESRLIGLGISFTTCVNLYRDGQEFTRGNAINYWNEPAEMVRELPRPLSKNGVVFLASKTDSATNYFRVRPDLIRRALCWLIANNPLYKHIRISEENLRELEDSNSNQEIPTIPVTDDEVNELRGQYKHVHIESQNTASTRITPDVSWSASEVCESSDTDTPGIIDDGTGSYARDGVDCATGSRDVIPSTTSNASDASENEEDLLENLTEPFELEVDQGSKQSEMEHILSAIGVNASDSKIPTAELHRRQDTIDEYKTKCTTASLLLVCSVSTASRVWWW